MKHAKFCSTMTSNYIGFNIKVNTNIYVENIYYFHKTSLTFSKVSIKKHNDMCAVFYIINNNVNHKI